MSASPQEGEADPERQELLNLPNAPPYAHNTATKKNIFTNKKMFRSVYGALFLTLDGKRR
jgi:hypothetical protein